MVLQERVVSSLEWLQENSTVVSVSWSRTNATLMLLISESRGTGLESVRMHANRVVLLRLSDSSRHHLDPPPESPEGLERAESGPEPSALRGAQRVVLHPKAVASFWQHAGYLSRLGTPLDTAAVREAIAEGAPLPCMRSLRGWA